MCPVPTSIVDLASQTRSACIWRYFFLCSLMSFNLKKAYMHQNCFKIWLTKPDFLFFDLKGSKNDILVKKVNFCKFWQKLPIFFLFQIHFLGLSIQLRYSRLKNSDCSCHFSWNIQPATVVHRGKILTYIHGLMVLQSFLILWHGPLFAQERLMFKLSLWAALNKANVMQPFSEQITLIILTDIILQLHESI